MMLNAPYSHTLSTASLPERWGAGVETQKNVRGEIGGWGRVPFNETYAPSLSTIYDGAQGSLNFLKMVLDPSPPPLNAGPVRCENACICVSGQDTAKTLRMIIWYNMFVLIVFSPLASQNNVRKSDVIDHRSYHHDDDYCLYHIKQ